MVEYGQRLDLAADSASSFYGLLQTSREGVVE